MRITTYKCDGCDSEGIKPALKYEFKRDQELMAEYHLCAGCQGRNMARVLKEMSMVWDIVVKGKVWR